MNSPITGKKMILQKQERNLVFRKEAFTVLFHYYLCKDSGEQFTSTKLDDININQVHNQYRDKHNLPFPDEIRNIRKKYKLPATKMSSLLGFGVNSFRNYENGEVPSQSNGKLIQLVANPYRFKEMVEISDALIDKERVKLIDRIDEIIRVEKKSKFDINLQNYFIDSGLPDVYTGYRKPSFERLTEMVIFFAERMTPWKTQLNKLLFYADFLNYRKTCFSMSGIKYRAITMGPVANNYNSIFEYMANKKAIEIINYEFSNNQVGEQFRAANDRKFNQEVFQGKEIKTLEEIFEKFKDKSTQELVSISHNEEAWKENQEKRALISYNYAFDLSEI